ncbi:MAG TPA: winged helix-turn-helix domain-containing protein [Allosphingosinicella sp.]|nr:winged helix-turn-helix domain-containing protein [Allosphingosinicella sp.]
MAQTTDSYLDLAEQILRRVRRPMSTREIMDEAYLLHLVPPHLHGRTQHNTLGARLSEDILLLRENSRFYRAHPGRFLLREFLDDAAIPAEHRNPIIAKRRERELPKSDILCLPMHLLSSLPKNAAGGIGPTHMAATLDSSHVRYLTCHHAPRDPYLPLTAFVVVMRGCLTLSYRVGRYREHRDTFQEKRTIGFTAPVTKQDRSLFDRGDHGATSAGLAALAIDLDMHVGSLARPLEDAATLLFYVLPEDGSPPDSVLAVVRYVAPDDFEPMTKRLAINDLAWLDLRQGFNNFDDFDPWTKHIISHQRDELLGQCERGSSTHLFDRGGALSPDPDDPQRLQSGSAGSSVVMRTAERRSALS